MTWYTLCQLETSTIIQNYYKRNMKGQINKELKADLSAKKVVYDNNPIDKMCLANTAVRTDINGNIQPVKTDDPRKRIDGTMALVDGYVVLRDKFDEYISLI